MAEKQDKRFRLDEVDGNEMFMVIKADFSVEYLITSPGDDPALRIQSKGEDALDKIMDHWKRTHTRCHNAWRKSHFSGIRKEVKDIIDDNGPQGNMFPSEKENAA
jgi:hypothetical protein